MLKFSFVLILVQITQVLEAWKIDDLHFVETRSSKHVLKCVRENQYVTITASTGVGKTATLQHVALQMVNEGYNVIPVTNTDDIVRFYNQNQKTLFVLDDFCITGNCSIKPFNMTCVESVNECKEKQANTKVVVALRL